MKSIKQKINEHVKKQIQEKGNEKVETNEESKQPTMDHSKLKPKKIKITKEVIEERLTTAYKNDIKVMLEDFTNSGLDVFSQRCDKCDHRTHSESTKGANTIAKKVNKTSSWDMNLICKGISVYWS